MKRRVLNNRTLGLVLSFIMGFVWINFCRVGCGIFNPEHDQQDGTMGILKLALTPTDYFLSKTIQPDLDLNIAGYNLYGRGPSEAAFEQTGIDNETVVQMALKPGDWEIFAEGLNAAGVAIGQGSLQIRLEAGVLAKGEIQIGPIAGLGILEIQVSWPESILIEPDLRGALGSTGEAPVQMEFNISSHPPSAVFHDTLISGYYTVSLQLWEGSTVAWGTVEAARILADHTSRRIYDLSCEMNLSAVDLTIIEVLQNPVEIVLYGVQDYVEPGMEYTVTASTNIPVDTYQWYLQGTLLSGEIDSLITFHGDLSPGKYWLDVVVTCNNIISSERVIFTVLDGDTAAGTTGILVINEIMADPAAVSDGTGEWFEVVNTGTTAVNVQNWCICDEGQDSHTIADSTVIPMGAYYIFGINSDSTINGGVQVNYQYSGITLTNSEDEIILVDQNREVVDAVRWSSENDFPLQSGASIALISIHLDNRWSMNWVVSDSVYGDGDRGTPGYSND